MPVVGLDRFVAQSVARAHAVFNPSSAGPTANMATSLLKHQETRLYPFVSHVEFEALIWQVIYPATPMS